MRVDNDLTKNVFYAAKVGNSDIGFQYYNVLNQEYTKDTRYIVAMPNCILAYTDEYWVASRIHVMYPGSMVFEAGDFCGLDRWIEWIQIDIHTFTEEKYNELDSGIFGVWGIESEIKLNEIIESHKK